MRLIELSLMMADSRTLALLHSCSPFRRCYLNLHSFIHLILRFTFYVLHFTILNFAGEGRSEASRRKRTSEASTTSS